MHRRGPWYLPLALWAVLGFGACALPSPTPPAPSPSPVAPGKTVTEADVDSIPLGAAEATVLAAFGPPERRVGLGEEGVEILVYRAFTAADPTRTAEFWIRAGKVTNKFLY